MENSIVSQKKIFVKNFLSLTSIELLNKLLPFLILPYLIRILGIEKFGLLMFALSLVQYFKSVSDYGFDLYSTREVSLNSNNSSKLSEIFSTTITIKLVMSFLLLLVFIFIIEYFSIFKNDNFIYYATYGMIFGYAILPTWMFQGMEKMKYLTYVILISRLLFIAFLLLFVKSEVDFYLVPLFESLSIVFSGVLAFYIALKKFNLHIRLPSKRLIILQIQDGWNIFVLDFVPNLYNNFTIFLLGVMTNNTIVGYYSIVYKISASGVLLINIIRNVTYPYLNKNFLYFEKVKFLLISSGMFLFISTYIFSEILVVIFTGEANETIILLLRIISISPFFIAIMAAFGTNFLLVKKYDNEYKKIIFHVSILGFFNSFWLIYFYSAIGAVITLVSTRGLIAILTYKKYKKINFNLLDSRL